MTTVWLWDADGPARSASGVTADDDAAKDAARQGMITTGAVTAMVEQATHLAGGGWMRSGYHRTGTGWTAERRGDRIGWSRFHRPELAEKILAIYPMAAQMAAENRRFLRTAMDYVLAQGITQYIDLGAGLPTPPAVHEIIRVRCQARGRRWRRRYVRNKDREHRRYGGEPAKMVTNSRMVIPKQTARKDIMMRYLRCR